MTVTRDNWALLWAGARSGVDSRRAAPQPEGGADPEGAALRALLEAGARADRADRRRDRSPRGQGDDDAGRARPRVLRAARGRRGRDEGRAADQYARRRR